MSLITAELVFAADVRRRGSEDKVTAHTLSETYESMQAMGDRQRTGVWYTPVEVARPIARMSMELALRGVGPTAQDVLRVVACDPACGCGVFLYEAAHILAAQHACRLIGRQPDADLVASVMPRVILECVFGIEIDPVAVELTRIALALETGGTLRPEILSRHVVCATTLEGQVDGFDLGLRARLMLGCVRPLLVCRP